MLQLEHVLANSIDCWFNKQSMPTKFVRLEETASGNADKNGTYRTDINYEHQSLKEPVCHSIILHKKTICPFIGYVKTFINRYYPFQHMRKLIFRNRISKNAHSHRDL